MTPPECPCPTQYINEGVRNSAIMSTNVCFDNTTARPFTHPNVYTLCVRFMLSINHWIFICWTHKFVQSLLLSRSYANIDGNLLLMELSNASFCSKLPFKTQEPKSIWITLYALLQHMITAIPTPKTHIYICTFLASTPFSHCLPLWGRSVGVGGEGYGDLWGWGGEWVVWWLRFCSSH